MKTLQTIFGVIVSTFFTTENGVTVSEVSRIQAESKQQNDSFQSKLSDAVAGIFQKEITFVGAGDGSSRTFPGVTITVEELSQYSEVADRNARTSNLMHAVKLYKRLQAQLESMDLRLFVVDRLPIAPERPDRAARATTCDTEDFMDLSNIDEMIGFLNPEVLAQFNLGFWKKANELNSRAAVLGKLLSAQGSFFRDLVKPTPKGSEQLNQSGVLITTWKKSYTEEQIGELSRLRDDLQGTYNDLQKQLNGMKKQIKDAVRAYNLDVERRYETAYGLYKVAAEKHSLEMEQIRSAAETLRQQALSEMANLRVRE